MSVVFVAAGAIGQNTAVAAKPAGVQVGDLLLIDWHSDDSTSGSLAGWTAISDVTYAKIGGGTHRHGTLGKIATSTETAASNFTVTGLGTTYPEVCCYAYRFALMPTVTGSTDNTGTNPALVVAKSGSIERVTGDFDGASFNAAAPSGFTRRLNGNSTFNFYNADRAVNAGTTTGVAGWNSLGNPNYGLLSMIIPPITAPTFVAAGTDHVGPTTIGTSTTRSVWSVDAGVKLLVVDVSLGETSVNVSGRTWGLTWGGQAMTQVGSEVVPSGSNSSALRRYVLVDPPTGAQNLVLTLSSGTGGGGILVLSYRTYVGDIGYRNAVTTQASSPATSPTLTVASAVGEVVDACFTHGDSITTLGASGNQRTIDNFSNATAGSSMTSGTWAGASSVGAFANSAVADHWSAIGMSIFENTGATSYSMSASGTGVSTGFADLDRVTPPTFFGAGTLFAAASGTAINPSYPASTLAGDVAVLVCAYNAATAFTTPTGWTLFGTSVNSANFSVATFYKRLVGGDATPSSTVTTMSTTNGGYGRIYVWRGVGNGSSPLEQVQVNGTPTLSTTPATLAMTPSGGGRMAAAIVALDDDNTWASGMPPAGWSNIGGLLSSATGGDAAIDAIQRLASGAQVAAVTVGTQIASDYWRVISFLLMPQIVKTISASGTGTFGGSAAMTAAGGGGGGGTPTITKDFTGSNGAGWGAEWTHSTPPSQAPMGGTNTIQSNRGRTTAGGGPFILRLSRLASSTHEDIDITYSMGVGDTLESYVEVFYRLGGLYAQGDALDGFPINCYTLDVQPNINQVNLQKIDSTGSGVNLATVNSAGINTTTRYNFRVRVVGNNHKVRWWTGTEPGTWQIDVNDATYTTGTFALGLYSGADNGTRQVDWDDIVLDFLDDAAALNLWKGIGAIRDSPEGDHLADDLALIDASWYYDWASYTPISGLQSVPSTPGVEYVPMMWGDWVNEARFDIGGDPASSIGTATTLLGFNEPNVTAQSNMTAARARALWPQLEATGLLLGSPAVSPNGVDDVTWLDTFLANTSGYQPHVDFLCVHWYPEYDGGFADVGDYLDYMHDRYDLPIWITEIGALSGGISANAALIDVVLDACATRPWVERIAWFKLRDMATDEWPNTGLVNRTTNVLNAAGTAYAAYPSIITETGGGRTFSADGTGTTTGSAALRLSNKLTGAGTGQTAGQATTALSTAIAATGTGAFTGSATWTPIAMTATGTGQTAGAAAIGFAPQNRPITAAGTGQTDGTAAMGRGYPMSAAGTGQTAGAADTRRNMLPIASGTGQTGGSAALISDNRLSASGSGQSAGSAAISRGYPLNSTGTGAFTGSAAISIFNGPISYNLIGNGLGQSGGSAALIFNPAVMTAAGTGQSGGSAALRQDFPTIASGVGQTGGSAAVTARNSITAAGTGSFGGSSELIATLPMTASGSGVTLGSAAIQTAGFKSLTASGFGTFGGNASIIGTRTITDVGVDVAPIRADGRYTLGELTADPPFAVTGLAPTTFVGELRQSMDVGELRSEPPVTLSGVLTGAWIVGEIEADPPFDAEAFFEPWTVAGIRED